MGAESRGAGGWFLDPSRADHCGDKFRLIPVPARGELLRAQSGRSPQLLTPRALASRTCPRRRSLSVGEAIGVTFILIANYPIIWTV
jgi:hypothetical protein